ncbi:hypothetical protein ACFVXC_05560 [Streptomyces sp. NPDC058257]|uniref:hypothetical protein n=1 Tax=Streptomyces sp. NPDC058257 TaxID=3346409 RepID=UPI0036EAE1CA
MSRHSTPRRQAARRFAKQRQQDREISNTLKDIQRTARAGIRALGADNAARTRTAVATTFAATRATLDARPVPPRTDPVPTPKTLWQAATGEPAPVTESVKAEPAPRVHTSIKAADVPKGTRDVCKIHKDRGDLSSEWYPVGYLDGDDGARVYARLHGASVRYSTAA